jgi:coatomer protein complex subunit gamma
MIAVDILKLAMKKNPYSTPAEDYNADENPPDFPAEDDPASLVFAPLPISFAKLERSLITYTTSGSSEPLTLASFILIADTESPIAVADDIECTGKLNGDALELESSKMVDASSAIYEIPDLASFGRVFRSCPSIPLTESETEYVVYCVRHILDEHVILQFQIQNTIEDQRLDNATVDVIPEDGSAYEVIGDIPADGIRYGETKDSFVILKRHGFSELSSSFHCSMTFCVVHLIEGEETGESYEEEYSLEEVSLSTFDFISKVDIPDFRMAWERLGVDNEIKERFLLSFKTLNEATLAILELLGMQVCDNTDTLTSNGKPQVLHLSGVYLGGKLVLVRARVSPVKDESPGILLQIAIRSEDKARSRIVLDSIT